MRPLAAAALALLVLLAGCSVGFQQGTTPTPAPDTDGSTATPTATATPDPATATATPTDSSTDTESETATPEPTMRENLPDPPSDRLGWENGYWYNETVSVNAADGLNETELEVVVARSMARVEQIRQLEFEETVPVTVINRSTFRERYGGGETTYAESFRTFDNVKFESLFLVGEDRDSLAVQNSNRGSSVLGFYSPVDDTIVVVSESDQPKLSGELTLGHELVHALQDQQFDLTRYERPTREKSNALNGLIEGDANYVEQQYQSRCDEGWECISVQTDGGGGGGDIHLGVYFVSFFPYSDGPGFVNYHQNRGGWEAVNDIYDAPPASTEQVIYPEKYGEDEPRDPALEDTTSGGWERVAPDRGGRPAYASFGQAGMSAMFAYTLYDSANRSYVVEPDAWLNREGGSVNATDPLNYGLEYTNGWDGDRLHVYDTPGEDNETAYVWRSVWDSPEDAREFAEGYRALLSHWGGDRAGSENHWVITRGPFQDAFYLEIEGDTVTIVNAPTASDLGEVYAGYEPATGS